MKIGISIRMKIECFGFYVNVKHESLICTWAWDNLWKVRHDIYQWPKFKTNCNICNEFFCQIGTILSNWNNLIRPTFKIGLFCTLRLKCALWNFFWLKKWLLHFIKCKFHPISSRDNWKIFQWSGTKSASEFDQILDKFEPFFLKSII